MTILRRKRERERGEDGDTVGCRDGDGTEETGTERGTGREEWRERGEGERREKRSGGRKRGKKEKG